MRIRIRFSAALMTGLLAAGLFLSGNGSALEVTVDTANEETVPFGNPEIWAYRQGPPYYSTLTDGTLTCVDYGQDGMVLFWPTGGAYRTVTPDQYATPGFEVYGANPTDLVIDKSDPGEYFYPDDNEGAWLYAAVKLDNNALAGYYHAEDHLNMDPVWLAHRSIIFALSPDRGVTWTKYYKVLSGHIPKANKHGGVGDLDVVRDPQHGNIFAMFFTDWELTRPAVAVSNDGIEFYKYFEGAYTEPGLGGEPHPIPMVHKAKGMSPTPHWNHYLNKWVLLWGAFDGPQGPGIYLSTAADLLFGPWEEPRLVVPSGPADSTGYPTVLGLDANGNVSDSSCGREGWLYRVHTCASSPCGITHDNTIHGAYNRLFLRLPISFDATPEPEFTASKTSGAASLAVQFADRSTWGPTSWAWDFNNDGTTDSTAQNPSHSYTSPGTYSVRLTVANAEGSVSEVKTDYIVVSPTRADFAANLDYVGTSTAVQFTDTSNFAATAWAWDFNNDGTTDSTAQNPSHTYTTTGVYTVTLTASASGYGSDAETKTGYITVAPGITVDTYVASTGFSGTQGTNRWYYYELDAAGNQQPLTYDAGQARWESAGANAYIEAAHRQAQGRSVSRAWKAPSLGTAVVRTNGNIAKLEDDNGDGISAYVTQDSDLAILNGCDIRWWATYDYDDTTGSTVSVTRGINTDEYLFFSVDPVYSSIYDRAHYDPVVYFVHGGNGVPAAEFSAALTSDTASYTVRFQDQSANSPTVWAWDFDNNGSTDSWERNPVHTFASAGPHSVKLTVYNDGGSSNKLYTLKLWRASTDYSLSFGANNWYYAKCTDEVGYTPLTANGSYWWDGSATSTRIFANSQSPDDTQGQYKKSAARQWATPNAGKVRVTGHVAKKATGGDGVVVAIVRPDFSSAWGPYFMAYDDTAGLGFDVAEPIASGGSMSFFLHPVNSGGSDECTWNPGITLLY